MTTVPSITRTDHGLDRFIFPLVVFVQLGVVSLGHLWGVAVHYPGWAPSQYTFSALMATVLIGIGGGIALYQSSAKVTVRRFSNTMWPFFYAITLMLCEAFLFVHTYAGFLIAILAMVPLLLIMGNLLRDRNWMGFLGVGLFLFTACAMTTSNVRVSDAGSGFFGGWY